MKKKLIIIAVACIGFFLGVETYCVLYTPLKLWKYTPKPVPNRLEISTKQDLLRSKVLVNGSVEAYKELKCYSDSTYKYDILYYALYMAHNYNYSEAFYDVHVIFKSMCEFCNSKNDNDTLLRQMSIEYLNQYNEFCTK